MPVDKEGQRFRAQIVEKLNDHDQALANDPDHLKFRVKVSGKGDEKWDELVAYNDLCQFISDDPQEDGSWKWSEIIDHKGGITAKDPWYMGSSVNVLVAWNTGEITWEPLGEIAKSDPVTCAVYAKKNDLLEKPGWKRFKQIAKRDKILVRAAKQAKLHSFRTKPVYMYGYLVPRNWEQAVEIDRKNGNTLWQDATKVELQGIIDYNAFKDGGLGAAAPPGYKKITVHLVYAVKHDGRHKARLVGGGHLTDTPIDSVYSSVASLKNIRMLVFISELNGYDFWSTDITLAYLESVTDEKVYVIGGPEFRDVGLEGHTLIIHKALYGLKSSGKRWSETFAEVLEDMGFFRSKAGNDIWMRDKGDHYEYLCTYVDDLGIASRDPQAIIDALENDYNFNLKGSGPIDFYLGCDYYRDDDGVLCMAPKKYIEKMVATYVRLFGQNPKHYKSPLDPGDHPEADTSPELDLEKTKIYQSMIGAAQWVIQIGRMDIATAVMTLSSFRANPREGHLDRIKRIYGYLANMKYGVIRFRTDMPDFSDLTDRRYDWEFTTYGGATEILPTGDGVPKPMGKPIQTVTYVDANLFHDVVTGKSVTGIIHYFNKTPVDWYSKKQSTVETATYGAEFVAARTAKEQIQDLRIQLTYLGVPIAGPSLMFGDNKSVVDSAAVPDSRLHKRHVALSYHSVREAIAAGMLRFIHIDGKCNPADILSKHWAYHTVWSLLQPLMFWEGDTMEAAAEKPKEISREGEAEDLSKSNAEAHQDIGE